MRPRGRRAPTTRDRPNAVGTAPGITVSFQANGNSSGAPESPHNALRRVSRPIVAGLSIVAGAFLAQPGLALWGAIRGIGDQPGLTTQLNNIVSEAGNDGYRLVGPVRLVQFRAAGLPSRVLLERPLDQTKRMSDRLVIYDIVGSGKKRRFKQSLLFEPLPPTPAEPARPVGAARAPRAYAIRLRLERNFDGQPGDELIADVSEFAVKPIWPRPIYVAWNATTEHFVVRGLLSPETTHLRSMRGVITQKLAPASDIYTHALMNYVYLRPSTILDATPGAPPVVAYAVEAYVLKVENLRDPRGVTAGGLALTAGYIVKSAGFGTAKLLQVITWHIDLRYDPPLARASYERQRIITVGTNWSRLTTLLVRSRR